MPGTASQPVNTDFEITATKDIFDKIFGVAAPFTSREVGEPAYLKCLHIEASHDTGVTVTAESKFGAVQLTRTDEIEVKQEGSILILASWLTTAINSMLPGQDIVLSHSKKDHVLRLETDTVNITLTLPTLGKGAAFPSIGEPDRENSVTLSPDDFVRIYTYGGSFRRDDTSKVGLDGVMIESLETESGQRLQALSTDMMGVCTDYADATVKGDGIGRMFLNHRSVSQALGFLREGAKVELCVDRSDSTNPKPHLFVLGKGGEELYHVRLSQNVSFDVGPILNRSKQLASATKFSVKLAKAELQRILRGAVNLGNLDPTGFEGQNKNIRLEIEDNELTASVKSAVSYEGSIPIDETTDPDREANFLFRYGLFGDIIDIYNNEQDPRSIYLGFGTNSTEDAIQYIVLHQGETNDIESSTFALIPTANGR